MNKKVVSIFLILTLLFGNIIFTSGCTDKNETEKAPVKSEIQIQEKNSKEDINLESVNSQKENVESEVKKDIKINSDEKSETKITETKNDSKVMEAKPIEKTKKEIPKLVIKETSKDEEKDKYLTDPIPEGKPKPVEPQDAQINNRELTCTISIDCSTILDNMEDLDPEKVELIPEDGVILAAKKVTFKEGESVFDVLQRETRNNKIHMEFEDTPMYNSAYIEGIHNLYEFDCGNLSGWMYKVNGWFPNYGCSRYQLEDGDVVEWVYTCD
ncbi:MAG: DUF4430 domain-containing protein, partial [Proteocatella sp.]